MCTSQNINASSTDAYGRVKKLAANGYLFIRLMSSSLVYGIINIPLDKLDPKANALRMDRPTEGHGRKDERTDGLIDIHTDRQTGR